MKKGQKVRVKSSGRIGVIADSEFFSWNYKKHVRYEVKFEGQKNTCWYPKEELSTELVEKATVVITAEGGSVTLVISNDMEKNDGCHIEITGCPENLRVHQGLHVSLATILLKGLSVTP